MSGQKAVNYKWITQFSKFFVMKGQKATNYPFNLRQNLNELAKKLAKNWMAKLQFTNP